MVPGLELVLVIRHCVGLAQGIVLSQCYVVLINMITYILNNQDMKGPRAVIATMR